MILKTEHIEKSFGRKSVLRDVSLNMNAGSIEGIVGENGSGKSTLLKIIVGRWKADNGSISINGKMGYCPQNIQLFPQLTVNENFRYFSAAYKLPKKEYLNSRDNLMDYFNFGNFRNEKIENLSGGTQQKLNLSIALLHQPDLLILDEPYNGFDWDTYLRFWDYTGNLQRSGCAVLIVTHLISEKQRFDRIHNLENGYLK
jgi:ABC-type multidrug transport system ATPase subunit